MGLGVEHTAEGRGAAQAAPAASNASRPKRIADDGRANKRTHRRDSDTTTTHTHTALDISHTHAMLACSLDRNTLNDQFEKSRFLFKFLLESTTTARGEE